MFFFVGPVLLILTVIFEWIMGNFFSMMVCGLFAVFWLSFGMLQLPTLGLATPYSTTGTNAVEGAASPEFNAVIALYLIVWGFALFTFFIFTLKTNIIFASIFLFVTMGAWVLSAAYWKVSTGDYAQAANLQKVSLATCPVFLALLLHSIAISRSLYMLLGLFLCPLVRTRLKQFLTEP